MPEKDKARDLSRARNQLDQIAWILDDMFRIPGLNWRFGLDALIGLIPGVGDVIGASLGLILLVRAIQFRLPGIVIARMIINSLIDLLVGAIPLVGDLFDFAWKSNSMNMKLFHKYAQEPEGSTTRHWMFIAILILFFAGAIGLIIVGMFLLLKQFLFAH